MIEKDEIKGLLKKYNTNNITMGTIGSHTALNIFRGAKDEGFKTLCICKRGDDIVYKRFHLVDKIIIVEDFNEILDDNIQEELRNNNTILIPHGTFNAYIDVKKIVNDLYVPIFGNRHLLPWEVDRERQKEWLKPPLVE